MSVLDAILDKADEQEIKKLNLIVDKIESLEKDMEIKENEQLKEMTNTFRLRLDKGESLDDILPEAFAVVREVSKRVLGMRQYKVQLIGGIVIHQGKIAEMKT
ncbi:preprotein translocase subunit SecA, partial [Acinetobacter baumannii]|nr:preprotein translocase subunit SecA [Acinetobacter baumannii]